MKKRGMLMVLIVLALCLISVGVAAYIRGFYHLNLTTDNLYLLETNVGSTFYATSDIFISGSQSSSVIPKVTYYLKTSSGELVTSETVIGTQAIIDFMVPKPGYYRVYVKRGVSVSVTIDGALVAE